MKRFPDHAGVQWDASGSLGNLTLDDDLRRQFEYHVHLYCPIVGPLISIF